MNPSVVAFDIDDTLTVSKQMIDPEMADLLSRLIKHTKVAIISGAAFEQIDTQILSHLSVDPAHLKNVYLLPTNGATLYEYKEGWNKVYSHDLTPEEKEQVFDAFEHAFEETGITPPEHVYGVLIEDRRTQITYSGLGSKAPVDEKKAWDPEHKKRDALRASLLPRLRGFSISMGGSTSIDITRNGVDKAYGLRELMKYLHIPASELLYIGDAFYKGGNDESVISLGVSFVSEEKPGLDDTKATIRSLLTTP